MNKQITTTIKPSNKRAWFPPDLPTVNPTTAHVNKFQSFSHINRDCRSIRGNLNDRDQHYQKKEKGNGVGTKERKNPRINILREAKEDNIKNRDQERALRN